MAVGQVSKRAAKVETVLNWRSVVHGSEVVLLDRQDHQLLKDLVTHHKLFARARDISVVVQDSHASVTSDLHLHCNVASEISMNLSLFGRMHSRVEGSSGIVEALVPDLINHL